MFLFSASDAVDKCEKEQKYWRAKHNIHSSAGYSARLYGRVKLSVLCGASADDVWVALSGLAVAIFTFTLWRSTEKLWFDGEKQIELTRQGLVHAHRPWLHEEVAVSGPLQYWPNEMASLNAAIRIKNIGNSPAKNVILKIKMCTGQTIKTGLQDQLSLELKEQRTYKFGSTLFPGQSMDIIIYNECKVEASLTQPPIVGDDAPLSFSIVGCIGYDSDFSDDQHHTGFCWDIYRTDPVHEGQFGISKRLGDIPRERLVAFRDFLGNSLTT